MLTKSYNLLPTLVINEMVLTRGPGRFVELNKLCELSIIFELGVN